MKRSAHTHRPSLTREIQIAIQILDKIDGGLFEAIGPFTAFQYKRRELNWPAQTIDEPAGKKLKLPAEARDALKHLEILVKRRCDEQFILASCVLLAQPTTFWRIPSRDFRRYKKAFQATADLAESCLYLENSSFILRLSDKEDDWQKYLELPGMLRQMANALVSEEMARHLEARLHVLKKNLLVHVWDHIYARCGQMRWHCLAQIISAYADEVVEGSTLKKQYERLGQTWLRFIGSKHYTGFLK